MKKGGRKSYEKFCVYLTEFPDKLLAVLSGTQEEWNEIEKRLGDLENNE